MLWCNQPIVDIYLYMLPLHDWCLSFCLQYASDNSKYHPHPHLGFHMTQRMMYLMMGCLCFGVLLILINIYQLRSINAGLAVGDPEFGSSSRPIVWINGKNVRNLYWSWTLQRLLVCWTQRGFAFVEQINCLKNPHCVFLFVPAINMSLLYVHDYLKLCIDSPIHISLMKVCLIFLCNF